MKFRTAIIGLFIFAFTATAHAQKTPINSRYHFTKKANKIDKDDIQVKKRAYLKKRKHYKMVSRKNAKANKMAIQKERMLLRQDRKKTPRRISRKSIKPTKPRTTRF